MVGCKYNNGDMIIKQGDDGDCLYVVEEGELECFKRFVIFPNIVQWRGKVSQALLCRRCIW